MLSVLESPARFKQICWHRRARKTTLGINKLILEAASTPNRVFAYIAPTYKQAKNIIWRDPRMLKAYLPKEILKKDFNESELYAELYNGAIIQIRGADDPDSLRGSDYCGIILDEWALIKPAIWEEILQPVLRENGGWAWFLFTPKGKNHAFRYWINAAEWRRANPKEWDLFFLNAKESALIPPEELERAAKEMPESLYRQEFLCEFLEGEGSVFKNINRCVVGDLQDPYPSARYIMGVDLAKTQDFTVIIVVDQMTKRVVAFDRFNEIAWGLQKEKIARLANKYNDALVYIDATGVGDPIVEDLRNNRVKVEPVKFTVEIKKELIERLMVAIEQRLILFPDIPILIEELQAFTYEITPTNFRYTAPDGLHDDCVIALALAVKGLQGNLYNRPYQMRELPREAILR